MSDLTEYKCPSCGGAMEFDSTVQKLKCLYCDTQIGIDEWNAQNGENEEEEIWQALGNISWTDEETAGMSVYVCSSCGGEIVTDQTTGASSCPFCGNPIVMKGQFAGDLKPDYIIPFKLDKKAAKEAYKKHLNGKAFLPGIFEQENHIDEIKGIYVPFWIFDSVVQGDILYKAETQRVWRQGDTEYTEHSFFDVQRAGTLSFEHLPVDCSRKMDDTLMESIEPYEFKYAVPFQKAYLAGYLADRYDVEMDTSRQKAQQRMRNSMEMALRPENREYQNVRTNQSDVRIQSARYWYALYPVWILNTTWQGKKYVFAMNGQTGKMVGDLPMDSKAFRKYVCLRGILIGVVLYALMWLFLML